MVQKEAITWRGVPLALSTDGPVASTVSSFEAGRGSFTLKQLGELLTVSGHQYLFL